MQKAYSDTLLPRCLKRPEAAAYAGMSEEKFLFSIREGLFKGPIADGDPEEVYDRKQIDYALGREYDEYAMWV
ncbi:hypothetical protein HJB67_12865 [Rhizobium lentis]|uniref:hypothetical protein n=1 Tax=Rhizobium lentis TaxID=1138194 RepID=UPI001C83FB31|nr:hypothetical protein [Rhizobium lentis]MBX5010846.1 hypothetical protein [Rhizobium lentis]